MATSIGYTILAAAYSLGAWRSGMGFKDLPQQVRETAMRRALLDDDGLAAEAIVGCGNNPELKALFLHSPGAYVAGLEDAVRKYVSSGFTHAEVNDLLQVEAISEGEFQSKTGTRMTGLLKISPMAFYEVARQAAYDYVERVLARAVEDALPGFESDQRNLLMEAIGHGC